MRPKKFITALCITAALSMVGCNGLGAGATDKGTTVATEATTEAKATTEAEAKTEAVTEEKKTEAAKEEKKTEAATEAKKEAATEAKAQETEKKEESKPETDTKSNSDSKSNNDTKSDSDSKSNNDSKSDSDSKSDNDTKSETKTDNSSQNQTVSEDKPSETVDLSGTWYGDVPYDRCSLTFTSTGNNTYAVEGHWGGSATDAAVWVMNVSLNAGTNKYEYTDGTYLIRTTKEDGSINEEIVYTNNSGSIIYDNGKIGWTSSGSDKDSIEGTVYFNKSE